jgi:hypothetical protein
MNQPAAGFAGNHIYVPRAHRFLERFGDIVQRLPNTTPDGAGVSGVAVVTLPPGLSPLPCRRDINAMAAMAMQNAMQTAGLSTAAQCPSLNGRNNGTG